MRSTYLLGWSDEAPFVGHTGSTTRRLSQVGMLGAAALKRPQRNILS